jgi:2-oxoacid:acceptor oxidoreductase delta subunit (pyruvate/2-ketoisovalerate family)
MSIKELSVRECPLNMIRRCHEKTLEVSKRLEGNPLVNQGFDEETAVAEAQRCLGNSRCQSCSVCQLFCPDLCINRDETTGNINIDYKSCHGCSICVAVCPKGAIEMMPEES